MSPSLPAVKEHPNDNEMPQMSHDLGHDTITTVRGWLGNETVT